MIQIYKPENTNFEANGDMPLLPEKALVHATLNGAWNLELQHPIDGEGRWKYITEEAVVKVPSFNGEQLFRIKHTEKAETGVTATAEPIFMDAREDCFLEDIRPTNKTGQEALNLMLAPNRKYSAESDITVRSTAYYEYKNFIEALNGNEDNSFINRWGGEIFFNNYEIIVNKKQGNDYGVQILYGKNIKKDGIQEEVDTREVVTRIFPKAYNGYKSTNPVDSELINKYPTVKIATMTFDDVKMQQDASEEDRANGVIICETQKELDKALEEKCRQQYESGIDKPKLSMSVEIVLLENTEEYREYKELEKVGLGDAVHCKHSKLGITTDARVIELEYDCLKKKTTQVELGDYKYNYFNNITSAANRIDNAIRPDGTVVGEQIQGLIDGVKAQMRAQSSAARKSNVRAVLFEDLDEQSPTYGALCLGTMGFQIASKRTVDGREWDWKTFGTGQGFAADLIVAGTMFADRIRGGELMSENYIEGLEGFKLDLNKGIIKAAQLLIETSAIGRVERGFRFNGGNLEILGVDGDVIASVHCCGSLPSTPEGLPSGWPSYTAFTGGTPKDSYQGGFWVRKDGDAVGISAGELDVNGKLAKTGRLEFSDGTFVELVNGIVVGGNTKEGAF
jgi:phage minor structural protein